LLKSAFILALLSVGIKVLGFGREVALSYQFGATLISDAYILSIAIPGFFFVIISSAINSVYIPYANKFDDDNEKLKLTNKLINIFAVLILLVIFLVNTFSAQLVELYIGGANSELKKIAEGMLGLTTITLFVRILIVILNSYLQIKGRYLPTNLIGLPLNIFIIISILIASEENYELLAVGFTVAMYSQLIVVIPFLLQCKYKYNFNLVRLEKFDFVIFSKLMSFVVIAAFVNQLNTVVDLRVASSLGVGYVSSINYALKLQILIQMIFVTSISIVFFPEIAKLYKIKKNTIGLLNQTIKTIVFFLTPISIFTFWESNAIINFIFGHGAFDINAIEKTSLALKYYSVGFLAFGVRELLLKDYYASNNMKKPLLFIGASTAINIALTLALANYYGIAGIAMATSISAYIFIMFIFFDIYKIKKSSILKVQYVEFTKCFVSASISYGLVSVFTMHNFIFDGLIFLLFYLIVSFFLKVKLYKSIGSKF
jgi:putative peptidoglycan lipid II flippase